MLEDLGGKLDEITGDMGARNARIDDVRKHAVQAMAEFMEQRARVVDAQKTRLAVAALGEVHHVDDDRQLRSVKLLLAAESAHPRAAPLRRPREIIAQEQRFWRAVAPNHLPCANVG